MTQFLFQRLVIDGVGLLGGSIGMAAKARGLAREVVGAGRSVERLEQARRLGAIDRHETEIDMALLGADGLILCTPPASIRQRLRNAKTGIPAGCFVTDVGSVKAAIVADAERALGPNALFVGSHPMAGSEKTGAEHARADLFEGAACILTPTPQTRQDALELGKRFWSALGSRVIELDPVRHDRLLAGVSHLPHIVAAALMQTLARGGEPMELVAAVAAGGLRDTTRIAASDPALWSEICGENREAVAAKLQDLIALLQEWQAALNDETGAATRRLFAEGAAGRARL